AGALTVLGVVALCAASVLWRRGLARRWWNVVGAAGLVLAAPFLVRYLGRGIAPPAGGVGFALWMSWEAAVATAAMGLVLTGAARPFAARCRCSSGTGGTRPPRRHGLRVTCTRGGWRRRSPKTTIRRASRSGLPRGSRKRRSAWRAWTSRRR